MSDTENSLNHTALSEEKPKRPPNNYIRATLLLIVLAIVIYLIVRHINVFGNILLVVLGFGAFVIIHEFGHFIVAKLSGIKVEAFSMFMPPTLLALQRTEAGLRVRILPKLLPKAKTKDEENDGPDEGILSFTLARAGKAGDTEYRIGLIPIGGFVKMLGQDDTGPVKKTDNPRSYATKPVATRMAVISAGVAFNALSAVIAFMIVFLVGIQLPPPIVGGVIPDSPAARAGIKVGDEITNIDGKSKSLDFSDILVTAALSGRNKQIKLKVKRGHEILDFAIVPQERQTSTGKMGDFGILRPQNLTVAKVTDPNKLRRETGFLPGDRVTAVNGKLVNSSWELVRIVQNTLEPSVTISAHRRDPLSGQVEQITTEIPLGWRVAPSYDIKSESELNHIYSMVPRLRINLVESGSDLHIGDIILAVADIDNPTYKELRDVTERYEAKQLPIRVLRADDKSVEKVLTLNVVPECPPDSQRALIGIGVVLDAQHPVVAKTIAAKQGPDKLPIPRGALVTSVNGVKVSSFNDIAGQISRHSGRPITINYQLQDNTTGRVVGKSTDVKRLIAVESIFAEVVPFKALKKLYKAAGPVDAVVMGYRKTVTFIAQTYLTLKGLIGGLISPKALIGPVGILAVSYTVVSDQPLINYVYLLALISACIAVVNFLPLPPFDGGHIVLLLIEKIKGSALSERTQGAVAYAGVVLIAALFLYLTFNDILNMFIH